MVNHKEGVQKQSCIVVHPVMPPYHLTAGQMRRCPQNALAEAEGLCLAIDLDIRGAYLQKIHDVRPATLFGKGAVEGLSAFIAQHKVHLCVINHNLSPIQQRNLERQLRCKVIDRTGLILEIFGARARTAEGRLQVELAALAYQKSRLVRSWTHLERQRGGFGFLGGPGESQLEMDRRLIVGRIEKIKKDLEKVKKTRHLHRRARKDMPLIALVGYTNAGKSTLFNRLTNADVFVQDLLFATLDPTMRIVRLPSGRKFVLSDTVGFISDLPHNLIESFHATLEEVECADVIVHVRDAAHHESDTQAKDVESVLDILNIDDQHTQRLEVLNKADLLIESGISSADCMLISALTGEGVDAFLIHLEKALDKFYIRLTVPLDVEDGENLAWLYKNTQVLSQRALETKLYVTIDVHRSFHDKVIHHMRRYQLRSA